MTPRFFSLSRRSTLNIIHYIRRHADIRRHRYSRIPVVIALGERVTLRSSFDLASRGKPIQGYAFEGLAS